MNEQKVKIYFTNCENQTNQIDHKTKQKEL